MGLFRQRYQTATDFGTASGQDCGDRRLRVGMGVCWCPWWMEMRLDRLHIDVRLHVHGLRVRMG